MQLLAFTLSVCRRKSKVLGLTPVANCPTMRAPLPQTTVSGMELLRQGLHFLDPFPDRTAHVTEFWVKGMRVKEVTLLLDQTQN